MKKIKIVISIILILILTIVPFLPILNVSAEDELVITTYGENEEGINPNLVTNKANLIVNGITNGDELSAYKIIDVFYNEQTNEMTYDFTSVFQTFLDQSTNESYKNMTMEDYFNLTSDIEDNNTGNDVITASTLNILVSNYTTYLRNHEDIIGNDMLTVNTTATKELEVGSYLILPKTTVTTSREDADFEILARERNLYGVMVGNLVITADINNKWTISDSTVHVKKAEYYSVVGLLNGGSEELMSGAIELQFNENISTYFTKKHIYWNELWLPYIPSNAINKIARTEIKISKGISYDKEQIYMTTAEGLKQFIDGKVTDGTGNTLATISFQEEQIIVTFNREFITKDTVQVLFDVSLNGDANVGLTGNEIVSTVVVADDPYVENSTTEIEITNTIYTYGLELTSFNNDNTTLLKGAKYEVYTKDDLSTDSLLGEFEVGEDGTGTFAGVAEGTVYLKQIKAPTGYQLIKEVIPVKIAIEESVDTDNDYYYEVTTNNQKMWFLPSTGGVGTVIYTVIGLAIIGVASILFIYSRKKSKKETKKVKE